jgi:glucan 1,3-beta-glucosidase
MAVTQISRIQHRRGLQQDLPQLATAELGWSVDEQRLFIGNGSLEEFAPTTGVTEILTSRSIDRGDLTRLLGSYTFFGNAAGYQAQTGSSSLNPTVRSMQDKFDDFVNVRDFGATGNGVTNDTSAINRALQQVYKSPNSVTNQATRRSIYFPGGTYIINDALIIPPNARLVGDGINSTLIKQTLANKNVIQFGDSTFLTGVSAGTTGGKLPGLVEITGISFINSNSSVTAPIISLDSASNVKITNSQITSNVTPGFYPNLISISTSAAASELITFDTCSFLNGGNAFSVTGTVAKLKITNSYFDRIANTTIDGGSLYGGTFVNNYYKTVGFYGNLVSASGIFSIGETFDQARVLDGLFLGNLSMATATGTSINTNQPVLYNILSNSSGRFTYEISNSSARRFGTFTFTTSGTAIIYDDEYTESTVSLNANLFANANSLVCSTTSGTATFKYNLTKFY